MKLPVTVILPTLNCKEKLVKHLDSIENWLSQVEEIIAIDSQSTDGTFELLKERLTPYNAHLISEDRGLYRCWNKAASLASQPYIYYSTMCDIISLSGLFELTHLMEKIQLDVLISPPKIFSEHALEHEVKWPIHYVQKYLKYSEGIAILNKFQTELMISAFLPASIIGSSASNLYRASVLKKYPFPEDVGTVGDSYWALKYLPSLKVGIAEKQFATFCWDGVRNGTWDESGDLMLKFKSEAEKLENGSHTIAYIHNYLTDECVRLQAAINEYDTYVKFLTRPFDVKVKDFIGKYTSVRYLLRRIFIRE